MTRFRSFNDSTSKRVLNMLVETAYSSLRELAVKKFRVIKFGVNNLWR